MVRDRPIHVGEGIDGYLEATTVGSDAHVALHGAAKLGGEVDGAAGKVVAEEGVQHLPDGVGVVLGGVQNIVQLVSRLWRTGTSWW